MSEAGEQPQDRKPASHLPVRKLISPRLWKHLLLGFVGLSVAGGLLWGGFVASGDHPYGPGFDLFFNLSRGRAVSYYNAAMLTLAGQLCLLIWWVRSQSRKDFSGNYRVWFWSSTACFAAAFIAITKAHVAWSQTAVWLWDFDIPNKETMSWLVPVGIPALVFYWLLQRDTRECGMSVNLLRLSSLTMLGAALWTLGIRLPEHELLSQYPLPEEIVQAGLPMVACFTLMFGLLIHSRYVIYETAEPPTARPSRWRSIFGKRKSSKEKSAQTSVRAKEPAAKEQPVAEPAATKRSKSPTRRGKKKTAAAKSSAQASAEDSASSRSALGKADDSGRRHWIDGPIDPAELKGLSKRERRQIRKQRREQQRAEAEQ